MYSSKYECYWKNSHFRVEDSHIDLAAGVYFQAMEVGCYRRWEDIPLLLQVVVDKSYLLDYFQGEGNWVSLEDIQSY